MLKHIALSRLFLALGVGLMPALAAPAAFAQSARAVAEAEAEENEAKEMIAWLRDIRYTGPRPAITGFAAAQPVEGFTAPAGDHGHTQAYRSAGGCVVFFMPTTADMFDVALKTKGLKCDGKLVQGKGEVQVLRKVKSGDKVNTVVGVLDGTFENGMLKGEGAKGNFSFGPDGQAIEDTYLFYGQFENSVLNGEGQRVWTGPKADRPNAISLQGRFKDGLPQNLIHVGRLNPEPGVEGDFLPLVYSPRGNYYVEQINANNGKLLSGHMFFYNDPVRWKVEYAMWKGYLEGSALTRSNRTENLYIVCENWEHAPDKIACKDGNAVGGYKGVFFGIERSPFSVALPFREKAPPFTVKPSQIVKFQLENSKLPGIPCNENITRCAGKLHALVLGTPLYWYGDAEMRDGSVYPVSARLHERASGEAYGGINDYQTDRVVATCSSFKSPTVCARGTIHYKDGAKATGEWRLDGVDFEQVSEAGRMGYVAKRNVGTRLNGDVRMEYADGAWSQLVYSGGKIESVDDCGTRDGAQVTCTVDDGVVEFSYRNTSRPRAQYARPVEQMRVPQASPPAYRPIQVPTRPVYVLPGMR